ncbi:flagellar hook protein FlgE [Erwinia persicina]|jgi:flagellar hook protein FlgE|uniref:Flagellar hook protein FlgE n=1 Tax=Erwinia plantamica TaxID=3237104 RepID=A0ABW7CQD9_9GAMM|nr:MULTISPECIES: flagellar hook protein FlgE [Erwinia]MCP1437365.1 flagellar hook protein FlgE [Erwinia persicina]MDN4628580.1 flagellar hook protein FlgE [Erwinia sp. PsM31]MDN8540736.1 flagellar hook protein FlgE [Erwinia sp. BC051422]
MAFSQAVSGLNAASSNLDVIGNNIANSATVGFKSATVSFADMFADSKVGLGVKVAAVTQDFNDGTTTSTSRGLDVAISQAGFFRMADASGAVYYSRNGQFTLDANRNIVNANGLQLTGYPATGTPPTVQTGANPVALSVPTTAMAAKSTSAAALVANLNSTDSVPTTTPLDINNTSSYNSKASMTTYDSLGNEHNLNLYFTKTADNAWTVNVKDGSSANPTADVGTFNMTFDTSGQMTSTATQAITLAGLNGSAATNFTLNMAGSQQQNTGTSTFGNPTQDGYKPGELTSYQINNDGTVVGNYSNEKTQTLGQIALANFANPEGLKSEGNNVWSATASSGQALVGLAGTGNLGTLTAGALESSNVDLSKELVNMIVAQRNYQSNAQTIKTQDQILNTLVNLR